MGLKVGEVKLEKYNPLWKDMFDKEKKELQSLFKDVAISIEHVGSTSIEGLSAKPIIDIAVGVNKLSDFEKVKKNFIIYPYFVKEDSSEGEILVRKGSENNRTHFIHVMEINESRYKETILFKNYLNTHPQSVIDYENLKKELAIKYANDRKMYTKSKNEFIQEIINKAK